MCKGDIDSIVKKSDSSKMKTLNLGQLAEFLNVSRRTMYNMIEDGRFNVKPIRRIYPRRWNIKDVEKWAGRK